MALFKYDVVTLLELVESRPCLWDKTLEAYKDKIVKQKAWNEIFRFLDEGYDELTTNEKKQVGEKITTKWINIKDAFLKSLKTKSGQGSKKTYVYAHHLQFLLKCSQKENTTDSLSNTDSSLTGQDSTSAANNKTDCIDDEYIDDYTNRSPSKKKTKKVTMSSRKLENIESQIIEELKKPERHTSPDDKFFVSFVPYLSDLSESEKIDLQMDILNSIKKIKQNRGQARSTPDTYTLSKSKANDERTYYKGTTQDPTTKNNQKQTLQTPFMIKNPQPSTSQSTVPRNDQQFLTQESSQSITNLIYHDAQIHRPPNDSEDEAPYKYNFTSLNPRSIQESPNIIIHDIQHIHGSAKEDDIQTERVDPNVYQKFFNKITYDDV